MPSSAQPGAVPGPLVTLSVLLMAAMTMMANATISPSLPGLRDHFADIPGIETLAGLVLTLPSVAIVLAAGIFGSLADRFDRQKLLIVYATLYAIGGGSGLVAETLPQLLAGRVVLGLGVAGTMTLAMTWGSDLWQGPARAKFMGWQGAFMSFGGVVVVLVGGILASIHWRGAFTVYLLVLPIAAVALVQLAPYARALRETRLERRVAHEAVEPFPWGTFAFVGPLSFFFMAVFYVMPTRMPFHLSSLGVTSSTQVGMVMAVLMLAALPGSLLYGRLRRYLSAMTVFALSYLLMGLGMALIGLTDSIAGAIAGSLVMGLGMGPSMPNYTTYFMARVPPSQRGRASGMMTTSFFAGQFAAPLVSAPLVAAFGLSHALEILGSAMVALSAVLGIAALRARAEPQPPAAQTLR